MNILKTLQLLAATTKRCSEKYTFLICQEILIDNQKIEQKPWKILVKETIFGKIADPQSLILSKKMDSITAIFY